MRKFNWLGDEMLALYHFAQSTCSIKVRLLLAEKNLAWQDNMLISSEHHHLSDWYLKLNPNGVVPTLVDESLPIFESTAILEYLEDKYTQTSFRPVDHYMRGQMRAFLVFVDVWPTPAVRTPSFQFGGLLEKFIAMSDKKFLSLIKKRPLKTEFYLSFDKNTGFTTEQIFNSFTVILRTIKRMDAMLTKFGGPWLMGQEYTLADIAVLPLIDRMQDLGLDGLWKEPYPSISKWLYKAQRRPATLKSYFQGSKLSEQFPKIVKGPGSLSEWTNKYFQVYRDNPQSRS